MDNATQRAALHLPVGMFGAWLAVVGWVFCFVFSIGFLVYEALEDWRIEDRGYKDVLGFLIGFGVGAVVIQLTLLLTGGSLR